MTQWHTKSRRKESGGLRKTAFARHKQLSEKGGVIALTRVITDANQNERQHISKTTGGHAKAKALRAKTANVADQATKTITKWEIQSVKQNQANKLFVRRNIITQNAIIEIKHADSTRLARVTSRPGQSGSVEAILLSPQETKQIESQLTKTTETKTPRKTSSQTHSTQTPQADTQPSLETKKAEKKTQKREKKQASG